MLPTHFPMVQNNIHILQSPSHQSLSLIHIYSDFNTSVKINYYDPYDYHSFENASEAILALQPDGVMVACLLYTSTPAISDKAAELTRLACEAARCV